MTTDFGDSISMKNQYQIPQTVTDTCAASNLPSLPLPSSAPPYRPRSNPTENFMPSHRSSASHISRSPSMVSSTNLSSTTRNQSTSDQQPASRKSVSSTVLGSYNSRASNSHEIVPDSLSSANVREAKAHQTMGYPAFSAFLASDDDGFVTRKFSTLHVRAILMMQDEIVQLEDRLAAIDRECAETQVSEADAYLYHNGSFRGDKLWHEERYHIVHRLASLLDKYDSLVLNFSRIKERPKAPKYALKNIRNWLEGYSQAITSYETGFLSEDKESDLIGTVDRQKTPLRKFLESIRWFRRSRLFRVQRPNHNEYLQTYSKVDGAIYYDDSKIDNAITATILFLGLTMLLVPAWGLQSVSSYSLRLAMITGFIAVFLGILLLVTPSKPFETMVGTAAYGALLMVFMQIGK